MTDMKNLKKAIAKHLDMPDDTESGSFDRLADHLYDIIQMEEFNDIDDFSNLPDNENFSSTQGEAESNEGGEIDDGNGGYVQKSFKDKIKTK